MTEKEVQNAKWCDISILELENDIKVLILLCENPENSTNLKKLLETNFFELKVLKNKNGEYNLKLDFIKTDFYILFETKKTIESYFPITWLVKSEVRFITTGYKGEGKLLHWSEDYQDLMRPSLN